MKVLIVGNKGNMGRRYSAVLSYLNIDYVGIDIIDNVIFRDENIFNDKKITHVLICTPTKYHIPKTLFYSEIYPMASILVEKPIALTACEAAKVKQIKHNKLYIVNNWAHVKEDMLRIGQNSVFYDYYQTGPHGLYIDCCQLLYLSKHIEHCSLKNVSPVFNVNINDKNITKENIDYSYIRMVYYWLKNDSSKLWDMTDALSMMEVVELYAKHMGTGTESID